VFPTPACTRGYITAGLAVLGLPGAGKDLARQGVVDAIRPDGGYDGAGRLCVPVGLSLAAQGKYPAKHGRYYLNVRNGELVVLNRGKPLVGKLVGDPAALAANAAGETPASR